MYEDRTIKPITTCKTKKKKKKLSPNPLKKISAMRVPKITTIVLIVSLKEI
jgi:hypothetical protein